MPDALLIFAALVAAGCDERESGPASVSAIGAAPQLRNPNLEPLDPAAAFLVDAAAQGLVAFNAAGEIEPALAQSWIVSDDGLRYTFRIRRATWADGSRVTAEQVAARLRAALSRASRNPLKPALGAIANVEAMTDQVLEISLRGPRPNLLQLLAQPEMGILRNAVGTGPYLIAGDDAGVVRLERPSGEDDEEEGSPPSDVVLLRGEPAARAAARFARNEADLVAGGSLADLPYARAAEAGDRLVFDPAAGLFGLAFARAEEGALADPAIRRALSMAIDREAIVRFFAVPGLQPRLTLLPALPDELPPPVAPDWASSPMAMRRELAARAVAALDRPLRLRVAMPAGPGYRILFAHLRRDWRLIGVEAERVASGASAELALVDTVAPALLAAWYLRHFTCDTGRACEATADEAIEAARLAQSPAQRREQLAKAERILAAATPFIPLSAPVRWSLVSPRLTGFRANVFARHPAGTLIAEEF